MKGVGRRYKEKQQKRVNCPECGKDLGRGSMDVHRQTQHSVARGGAVKEVERDGGGNKPREYNMVFLTKEVKSPCPVEGCSGRAEMRTAMQMHFWHWQVR